MSNKFIMKVYFFLIIKIYLYCITLYIGGILQYILFLALIVTIGILYLYFDKKLANTRKQLMITTNQLRNLKGEYRATLTKPLNIQFLTPSFQIGLTNTGVNLYLAPTLDSPKLNTLSIKMEVKILDSAIANNSTWFYVAIPIDSNINCRGWINKKDFSTFYSDSNNIINSYK